MRESVQLLMYVRDPSIPLNSEKNANNQLSREFNSKLALLWFVLWNREARAAVKANRFQMLEKKRQEGSGSRAYFSV